jgi:hypothetical protein
VSLPLRPRLDAVCIPQRKPRKLQSIPENEVLIFK